MKTTTNAIVHLKIVCNCFHLTKKKHIKKELNNEFIRCRAHGNCEDDDGNDDDDEDDDDDDKIQCRWNGGN